MQQQLQTFPTGLLRQNNIGKLNYKMKMGLVQRADCKVKPHITKITLPVRTTDLIYITRLHAQFSPTNGKQLESTAQN